MWYDTTRFVIRYDTIWFDMIWYNALWYSFDMTSCICFDLIRYDAVRTTSCVWYDIMFYDMKGHDLIWRHVKHMIWHDLIWYVTRWNDTAWRIRCDMIGYGHGYSTHLDVYRCLNVFPPNAKCPQTVGKDPKFCRTGVPAWTLAAPPFCHFGVSRNRGDEPGSSDNQLLVNWLVDRAGQAWCDMMWLQ